MYAAQFRLNPGRNIGKKAQATAAKLQDAFLFCLERHAWAEMSVPLVARRAGYSPATVYQYFATLSDLAMSVAERLASQDKPLPKHLDLVIQILKFEVEEGLFAPSDTVLYPSPAASA